ncbi:3-ketosteroid-delta-1-dehydrogenase [Lysinibacillus sphaericus]|uniref:NUMOD4 domain-containing protein n=1 Tax=Lysinibacillus sphaericus TaxID=1421 RepID=UPI0018CEDFB4|nr:NUMOD4 domain-containing protein [Lysinibacillus sphaericus]MBG9456120.1 3-ketosteroid-delta-1-dehydrogenase [Lysinibacillus sphaericus]MBG9477503.1 3-ketosteroid-delta-1-dehydrogenase [Lysinibacillus sphaericus]MBG9593492.1 3-ketosteroid-delta-1-dehydrogenase [Lysinibacillus sphaericus]
MILTKQQAIQALKKNKFIGFTTKTGNIIMKKMNKTDYNIFVFEEGKDKPVRYVGSIMNIMATMSDKASNKDFVVMEQLAPQNNEEASTVETEEVKEVATSVEKEEVKETTKPAEKEEIKEAAKPVEKNEVKEVKKEKKEKTAEINEETRAISGYEGLYEVTASGRIINVRVNRPLARCNDEYGFHIVRLTKEGTASSHNVFELWKQAYPELEQTNFKGALKAKYGTGCKLSDKPGIHF